MPDAPKPTSPAAVSPAPLAAITAAAPAPAEAPPVAWEWGLSVPPTSLPSVAEGLTEPPRRPVLPSSSHVQVQGRSKGETVWNPLEGDPLRMAALGASPSVQTGLTPPSVVSADGNGAVAKAPDEAPAPSTTPRGARLRPVTGRRHREPLPPATVNITAGSYRSNLFPSAAVPAAVPAAIPTGAFSGMVEDVPRPSRPGRGRVVAALLLAVILSAAGAGAIWVMVPERFVLQASLPFERSGEGKIDNHALGDFHERTETLLWSRDVRDAAIELLRKRAADVDPGFLANLHQLTGAARLAWNPSPDAKRDELSIEYATAEPAADAERLTALFDTLRAASAAQSSGSRVDEMKLQLLKTDIAQYTREIDYLKRRLQALEEELRMVRLGAPREGEIDALKEDVARHLAAYQNVLAARIRAEVEAGAALPQTTMPSTMPATELIPPAQEGQLDLAHQRKLEREALAELRTKEKHLAEAVAQQESIDENERERNAVTDTMNSLSRSLEERQTELAAITRERDTVFEPLSPSPARVIDEDDSRPLWIGLAIAGISLCFAGYIAFASRGGGPGSGGGARGGL